MQRTGITLEITTTLTRTLIPGDVPSALTPSVALCVLVDAT